MSLKKKILEPEKKETEAKVEKKEKPKKAEKTTAQKTEEKTLTDLKGMGAKTLEKLKEARVTTIKALLRAKPKNLAEKTGLKEDKIIAWQTEAEK